MKLRDWIGMFIFSLALAGLVYLNWSSSQQKMEWKECCEEAKRCSE